MKKSTANPFTISFGLRPENYIRRQDLKDRLINAFLSDPSPTHNYMITGVRGSGKTSFMTDIADFFNEKEQWIVIDLNPERDMLKSLAVQLYSHEKYLHIRDMLHLNISLPFVGLSAGDDPLAGDTEILLSKLLSGLENGSKKLLITIDEAVNNSFVKVFAAEFQGFLRKEYPVFLIMTGLYENIRELQNEKSLTFLYRSPRISLESLSLIAIKTSYKRIFELKDEMAAKMSSITMGYPFAYQILGYFYWEYREQESFDQIITRFELYLYEYAYEKIWSELSRNDRAVLRTMAETNLSDVTEIRRQAGMKSNEFSVYRKRLLDKGVVIAPAYSQIIFALPRFGGFVKEMSFFEI